MKQQTKPRNIALLVLTAMFAGSAHAEEAAKVRPTKIDVVEMRSVPAGNYLVTLQLDGKEQRVNIQVNGDAAKCVNTSAPRLTGMEGTFQPIGNGVFMVFFRSDAGHRASQFWIFRNDGSAAVKEIPDRGETQIAIPVRDESIDPPKKS